MKFFIPALILSCLLALSCRHKPVIQPDINNACDTTNVSFRKSVQPILNRNCGSCHSSGDPAHGIILDNYKSVRIFAAEGSLYGAITRNGEYAPMPYDAPKLDVCSIATIHHWIIEGMKDN